MRIVWLIALLIAPIYSRDVVSKVYFHLTIGCRHNYQDFFKYNIRFYKNHDGYNENAISDRYINGRIPGGGQVSQIYEGTVTGQEGSEYVTTLNIQHKCGLDWMPRNDLIFFIGTCKIKPAAPCHIYYFFELWRGDVRYEATPKIVQ